MNKIDNMALFVRVVKVGGLAAAGRQVGLSPASMTGRINALEKHYNARFLNRTTRKISLTSVGQRFYDACLRVLAEVEEAEAVLQSSEQDLCGSLRVTASFDFGRQFVAPALADFVNLYPGVIPYLHLTDGVTDLVEQGFDLGIRFGNLPDSNLIVRRLADNPRVLVASPSYLKKHGMPKQPKDLEQRSCLVMERLGEPLNEWYFHSKQATQRINVTPAFMSNDGAIIRHWALSGAGIAYKSFWDVKNDLAAERLITVLDDFVLGFQASDNEDAGLKIVYPSRRYVPRQVTGFIEFLQNKMSEAS
ncbi:MAG: LysR family transcriptional regulator [Pseudomonadales bacterium]